MAKKITIYVEENDRFFKVSSIYLLKDGSFKVDVPYCKYDRGVVMKFPTNYKESSIPASRILKRYFTTRRPQLSIHASGFTQFSGPGIISGIDKVTGEIKGLGLLSHPLSQPVWSGPTFSIVCWGISKGFEEVTNLPTGSFVYSNDQLVPFAKGIDKSNLNCIRLDGWIIPFSGTNTEAGIYKSNDGEAILVHLPNTPASFHVPMRIIRLNNIPCVIGLCPVLFQPEIAQKYELGFTLSSPGEKSKELKDHWDVMIAIYPDDSDGDFPFLDYTGSAAI